MPTHVLYIDDSGTKEYASDPDLYSVKGGNSQYFVFGGVLTTTVEAGLLRDAIVDLKHDCFRTGNVEIKSNWLRIPYERERRYLSKFNISEERLRVFVEDYYDLVIARDITFIAAVIDKMHMQEDYKYPWYPPAVAYELLLQRAEQWLPVGSELAVVIDDMTGATPAGNQYKRNLINQHRQLRQRGSTLMRGFDFACLRSQRFINSAISHLIQTADIVAYNVYRQFIEYGAEWESLALTKLPTYIYFDRFAKKFRQDANGRVQGYGIVKFPLRVRMPWAVDL